MSDHIPDIKKQYLNVVDTEVLKEKIDATTRALRKYVLHFDAIAFRGMSGALVAPSVAIRLRKSIIMVRKPEQKHHSMLGVEGDAAARSYVIVDDFVSSGETVREIREKVFEFAPQAEYKGTYTYRDGWNDNEF